MDLTVEEVLDGLFSEEAYNTPSDSVKVEELVMELPEWFDKKKYEQGRRFQNDFYFGQSVSMMMGLISVIAIPTILDVLVSTKRSNSEFTAYKRYLSTYYHTMSWIECELKPGSRSWRSLYLIRSHHVRSGRAARLKGQGQTVSQRDVAITIWGFIGYTVLKADKLGIRQLRPGDWEGFNHFWSVIGHMFGVQDRYNICRKTYAETRKMCEQIQYRVYSPCLENVPEFFEHSARVMLDGLGTLHSAVECELLLFLTRYFCNVPGYIYTEQDRLALVDKIQKCLNGKPADTGVDPRELMGSCPLPLKKHQTSLLYLQDFETIDDSPAYKQLLFKTKYKLALFSLVAAFNATYIGRLILNFHFKFYVFLSRYLPYAAMWRYGVAKAYTDMFKDGPIDPTPPKPNSEYYKPRKEESRLEAFLSMLW